MDQRDFNGMLTCWAFLLLLEVFGLVIAFQIRPPYRDVWWWLSVISSVVCFAGVSLLIALRCLYDGEDEDADVFGGASWAEDLDAISRAGLKTRK